jgi:hypothetical protein
MRIQNRSRYRFRLPLVVRYVNHPLFLLTLLATYTNHDYLDLAFLDHLDWSVYTTITSNTTNRSANTLAKSTIEAAQPHTPPSTKTRLGTNQQKTERKRNNQTDKRISNTQASTSPPSAAAISSTPSSKTSVLLPWARFKASVSHQSILDTKKGRNTCTANTAKLRSEGE